MKRFAKIVAKRSALDVSQGCEYGFLVHSFGEMLMTNHLVFSCLSRSYFTILFRMSKIEGHLAFHK